MTLTQKTLDNAMNSKKTQLGVGFGGEPKSSKKMPAPSSMRGVPMRNDAQAFDQYPKAKAIGKALIKAKR